MCGKPIHRNRVDRGRGPLRGESLMSERHTSYYAGHWCMDPRNGTNSPTESPTVYLLLSSLIPNYTGEGERKIEILSCNFARPVHLYRDAPVIGERALESDSNGSHKDSHHRLGSHSLPRLRLIARANFFFITFHCNLIKIFVTNFNREHFICIKH